MRACNRPQAAHATQPLLIVVVGVPDSSCLLAPPGAPHRHGRVHEPEPVYLCGLV